MAEPAVSPIVRVELKLDESLQPLLDSQASLVVAVRDAIEREVSDVVRTVGIPGSVAVELSRWVRDGGKAGQTWMRLCVNERVCRFPDQLLRFVHAYVNETLPSPQTSAQSVFGWLLKQAVEEVQADGQQTGRVAEFFGLTCRHAVIASASLLLAEPQVRAYATALPRSARGETAITGCQQQPRSFPSSALFWMPSVPLRMGQRWRRSPATRIARRRMLSRTFSMRCHRRR